MQLVPQYVCAITCQLVLPVSGQAEQFVDKAIQSLDDQTQTFLHPRYIVTEILDE